MGKDLGKRIREIRQSKGMTQEKLARKANIPQSSLAELENGKRTTVRFDRICSVADALGVELEYLVRGRENYIDPNLNYLEDRKDHKLIFAKNVNYYLNSQNKTQTDLCNDLGLSTSTVSNWCRGEKLPRMNKLEIVAKYLGVSKSDLLEERKDSDPSSKSENVNYRNIEGIIEFYINESEKELLEPSTEVNRVIYLKGLLEGLHKCKDLVTSEVFKGK